MKVRFPHAKRWLGGALIILLVSLGCYSGRQALRVTAVQNAVYRDWEISYWAPGTSDRPAALPAYLDSAANAWFERRYEYTIGYSGDEPAKTRNRSIVYFERFRALFRAPITDVHVYYPERIGDLGAALARFPSLRRMSLREMDGDSEADWTLLCTRLRTIPHLEGISLAGNWLTDKALAPLAGHPNLWKIEIIGGRLTSESTRTFASFPNLKKLHIEGQIYEGDDWLTKEKKEALINALPRGVLLEAE